MLPRFVKTTIVNINSSVVEALGYSALAIIACLVYGYTLWQVIINHLIIFPQLFVYVIVLTIILVNIIYIVYQKIRVYALLKSPQSVIQLQIQKDKIQLVCANNQTISARLLKLRVNRIFAYYYYQPIDTPLSKSVGESRYNSNQKLALSSLIKRLHRFFHLGRRKPKAQHYWLFMPKLSVQKQKTILRHFYYWRFGQTLS